MASYRVEVTEEARREIRQLPGNVRQRIVRLLRALEQDPQPASSRRLDTAREGIDLPSGTELRRARLASWRVVYLTEYESQLITVLTVRQRPPYQYDDLQDLVTGT